MTSTKSDAATGSASLIQYFIDIIECKDLYTQGHSHHVKAVAEAMTDCLPEEYLRRFDREKLLMAALLHDIGKIKTPDHILNKDGKLLDDEWALMKLHPMHGKEILAETPFAEFGDWILYHHERMDGRGYYGLTADAIPLESRIIAIADTFSALRTYRIYRPAKPIGETIDIMREAAGSQLDEELLSCFLSMDIDILEGLECNCEICRRRRQSLNNPAAV